MKDFWNQLRGASKGVDKTLPALVSAPAARGLSVWVGHFTDELYLDGYLRSAFRRDHGCLPHEASEYVVHPTAFRLAGLLDRTFFVEHRGERLLAAAPGAGGASASGALTHVHHPHTEETATQNPLQFVGANQLLVGP